MNENLDLVVRPKFYFLLAVGCWILGWSSLLFGGNPFPPGKGLEMTILCILGFSVLSLLGPVGAIMFSWQINGRKNKLSVKKFFGIVCREYSLSDIEDANLIPGQKGKTHARIELKFNDGLTIKADWMSSGFKDLWIYLGGKEENIMKID